MNGLLGCIHRQEQRFKVIHDKPGEKWTFSCPLVHFFRKTARWSIYTSHILKLFDSCAILLVLFPLSSVIKQFLAVLAGIFLGIALKICNEAQMVVVSI